MGKEKTHVKGKKAPSRSIPVRFYQNQIDALEYAAQATGLSQQELIRMAAMIGVEHLKTINYEVISELHKAADRKSSEL